MFLKNRKKYIIILLSIGDDYMKLAFIGAGNMATAIIKSIVNSCRMSPDSIFVFDKFSEKVDALSELGIIKCSTLKDACNSAEVIVLAVKPQDYEALLLDISKNTDKLESKIFVSIAAAISCDYICKTLGIECPVIRVMPNTPMLLGVGATAISRNKLVNDKNYSKICVLFACAGTVCSLDEDMMNKVISVNSSSPVYLYMLAKYMTDKAIEYGISEKNAAELVYQTLKGSVEMLMKSNKTPEELIRMVASPGGTTLAAISSLENNGYEKIINDAMDACTKRADELSR